jgi:hypothetical protein
MGLVSGVSGSAAESGEEMELRVGVPAKPDELERDMGVDGSSLRGDAMLLLLLAVADEMLALRAAMSAAVSPLGGGHDEMPMADVRRSM